MNITKGDRIVRQRGNYYYTKVDDKPNRGSKVVGRFKSESDALLDAAAPDMYEALKAVRAKVNVWSGTGKFQDLQDEIQNVNAALALAEGRE